MGVLLYTLIRENIIIREKFPVYEGVSKSFEPQAFSPFR